MCQRTSGYAKVAGMDLYSINQSLGKPVQVQEEVWNHAGYMLDVCVDQILICESLSNRNKTDIFLKWMMNGDE